MIDCLEIIGRFELNGMASHREILDLWTEDEETLDNDRVFW